MIITLKYATRTGFTAAAGLTNLEIEEFDLVETGVNIPEMKETYVFTTRHEVVLHQLREMLYSIPDDTGLTEEEVKLELATKIVENFPKGIQSDVDANLSQAFNLMTEAGAYLGGTLHKEEDNGL